MDVHRPLGRRLQLITFHTSRISLAVLLTVAACRSRDAQSTDSARPVTASAAVTPSEAKGLPEVARDALLALKTKDTARLAALVHPTKGVRFSPYAFVHDSDVVVTRDQVATLFASSAKRHWGTADGSGAPLDLTYADYDRRFVYSSDFLAAPRTARDSLPLQSGNTPSNLAAAYPGAHWIEYHFPGFDPKYGGMDWQSLWLVFEQAGSAWYLVGIVHGSWTI